MQKNLSDQGHRLKTVTQNEIVAPGVHLISFTPPLPFVAGQMTAVSITRSGPKRLYSIASGETDPETSILFDIKPDGALTPSLALVKPGDTLACSPAQGSFLATTEPAWLIASGTGIAPFRSMLRSSQTANKRIIHGGRFLDSFYFQDEFKKAGINYVRCCTRQTAEGIYQGRLTQYLREADLPLSGCRYYLCGSAEMVVETRDLLIGRGISFDNILSEIYF